MALSQAIKALQKALPDQKLIPQGTEEFDRLNKSYLSAIQSDITPAYIFRPQTKEAISTFLQTINPFATGGEIEFAIRGGGQQPAPGCSNIQDGITLDLSLLTGVELKDGIISIAAGERWSKVYEKLDGKGLGVAGGRSGRGGIGGLALQGGLSIFSSREGFVCDNVVNYEIVLASGAIVNANAKENSDLWIALKGGANNFGVVTQYDMKTFTQGPFWGGSVYYFQPSFPLQIEAMVKELRNPNATEETHLMISIGYAAQFGQIMCHNQVYYTQAVERPPVLEPFTTIQPQVDQLNSMRIQSLVESASEQASDAMDRQRCAYMNTTLKADITTLQAVADIYTSALDPLKSLEGLICSLTLQPYPNSLLKKSALHGGNSLGLDPADGPLVSVLLLTYWKNNSDDEIVLGVMKETLEKVEKAAVSRNQAADFKYMNYSFNFQDPIGSYGPENKQKLQKVSQKYDPEGLFQKSVPGGFKLFT
ncbi:hypothetical protein AJ78_04372 [Emergomyces pasteurianus Ep9510]|uniref:FAD-binding PCMH-type domain-containing protein n=1 Tax=Emergomyces pasteurianus Ep9510 TaxID=1447872 RepID=A0A1J9QGR5_9EURO|nr:hypothetical protein AJ78_04372 [Emergomyces pasteurianus Ep9510]